MFYYIFLYILFFSCIYAHVNVTTFFDCNGGSCYAPLIQPWNASKYTFYDKDLPRLINGTLFVTGAFSNSVDISCFDCVLLEIENKKLIVQKTNTCPEWSQGCDSFHIDLCIPGFDNLLFSTANVCNSVDIMSAEQSSINGKWYNFYDTLIEAKENCKLLPFRYQKGCELFCDLDLSNTFKEGTFEKIECP